MLAGKLRQRVTLRKKIDVPDGHYSFTEDEVLVANRIPASVVQLEGRALDVARQIDPRATHRIELRFRSDVVSGMEVVYHDPHRGNRLLEVVGPVVDEQEQHRKIVLTCKEAA